jgi:hypothetical protein
MPYHALMSLALRALAEVPRLDPERTAGATRLAAWWLSAGGLPETLPTVTVTVNGSLSRENTVSSQVSKAL